MKTPVTTGTMSSSNMEEATEEEGALLPTFEDKALIEEIRMYPCLFFNGDKNYKKKDKQNLCWQDIGDNLFCKGMILSQQNICI